MAKPLKLWKSYTLIENLFSLYMKSFLKQMPIKFMENSWALWKMYHLVEENIRDLSDRLRKLSVHYW